MADFSSKQEQQNDNSRWEHRLFELDTNFRTKPSLSNCFKY